MTSPTLVVTKSDGSQIDHIGLACRDLEEGIRDFRDLTGLDARANPAPASVPFRNAYVRIGDAAFLEILGPNPEHRGVHPLKSLLKQFSKPTLWFWYVSTDDFDGLAKTIRDAGRRIERRTEVAAGTMGPAYVGASIGPGFWPVYPNIIQWKGNVKDLLKGMPIVSIGTFLVIVGHDIEVAKRFYESVGINSACLRASDDEKSYLSLTLETPDKGPVTFKSVVKPLSTWTVLKVLLKDLTGFL